jgi:cobalt/nickel transport protein
MKKKRNTVIALSAAAVLIMLVPLFLLRGAQFEGSDGAGSDMVGEVTGGAYEPWFEPVLEALIGGELPGEMETLFFCLQTGIGVGIIAYCFGYLAARQKYGGDKA